jgi:hypothetical protein
MRMPRPLIRCVLITCARDGACRAPTVTRAARLRTTSSLYGHVDKVLAYRPGPDTAAQTAVLAHWTDTAIVSLLRAAALATAARATEGPQGKRRRRAPEPAPVLAPNGGTDPLPAEVAAAAVGVQTVLGLNHRLLADHLLLLWQALLPAAIDHDGNDDTMQTNAAAALVAVCETYTRLRETGALWQALSAACADPAVHVRMSLDAPLAAPLEAALAHTTAALPPPLRAAWLAELVQPTVHVLHRHDGWSLGAAAAAQCWAQAVAVAVRPLALSDTATDARVVASAGTLYTEVLLPWLLRLPNSTCARACVPVQPALAVLSLATMGTEL